MMAKALLGLFRVGEDVSGTAEYRGPGRADRKLGSKPRVSTAVRGRTTP